MKAADAADPPADSTRSFTRASCRVFNQLPGGVTNIGSGTLIDVTAGGQSGLVLTCDHLWSEGDGRVTVKFADGTTHGGLLVGIDRDADLAAVEISQPQTAPTSVGEIGLESSTLTACGFGPSGSFQPIRGRNLGTVAGQGQESVKLAGAVRSGDSGGGVFDEQGRLVAVVWGESGGVTYASTGGPLRRFVQRVLGRRANAIAARTPPSENLQATVSCPDGRCPLVGRQPGVVGGAPAGRNPATGVKPPVVAKPVPIAPPSCDCKARLAELEALSRERHDSLADRIEGLAPTASAGQALGTLAATLLGVSGPAGWGIIAAATLGGWFLGQRLKRKRGAAAAAGSFREVEPTGPSHSVEVRQPIERDDREARELLRLSQLEGRDPLQDAVAGRIALDRLDEAAESRADPQRARWADELRRELRERFNDIAPTKLTV